MIVHTAMITTILKLIPYLHYKQDGNQEKIDSWEELSGGLQYEIVQNLQSLLRQEKNQQIMCEAGFMTDIISIAGNALENETHILHTPFQYLV